MQPTRKPFCSVIADRLPPKAYPDLVNVLYCAGRDSTISILAVSGVYVYTRGLYYGPRYAVLLPHASDICTDVVNVMYSVRGV